MTAPDRVNIVYVGDTVPGLLPFLDTLIRHTAWRFRLVANGCDEIGLAALERVAGEHADRIDVHVVSTGRVVQHGEVLDRLLELETGQLFCFVDSDVFARGPVDLAELVPAGGELMRWSGLPVFHGGETPVRPAYHRRVVHGFVRLADGTPLTGTYVACYRTAAVRDVIARHGVGFSFVRWDRLPPDVRAVLARRGLDRRFYDTGQLIGLLFEGGPNPSYRQIPSLVHVGTWTSRSLMRKPKARIGRLLKGRLPWAYRWWAATWVVTKRSGWREARDEARNLCRQERAILDLEAIGRGTVPYDLAPAWIDDEELFDDLRRVLGESIAATSAARPAR